MLRFGWKKRGFLPAAWFLLVLAFVFLMLPSFRVEASEAARWPAEPSKSVKKDGSLCVDLSNASQGYFLASISKASKTRFKLRVEKGKETLTYDLNGDCRYEVFPFQLGDGKYEISLYKNVSGKKYSSAGKITVKVELDEEQVCFYYPNQYVCYTPETEPVGMADKLCDGKTEVESYEEVCGFIAKGFVYDYIKAATIKAGMLPDIDGCYLKRMGVCQDLSAVMCCMLRSQGIPARLMIGYADKNYHAWVEATFSGKDYFFDPTVAVNGIGKVAEYTVERWY